MLEKLTSGINGTPTFSSFYLDDFNPLSGTRKRRLIHAPNNAMRVVHRRFIRLLRQIQILGGPSPYATAALPGCSPLHNVERHSNQRYLYLLDLSSAYLNVDGRLLGQILATQIAQIQGALLATPAEIADMQAFLDQYCLGVDHGLLTGAPASPDLFNIYAGHLIDRQLAPLLRRHGLTYTRYLDDLTFSSSEPIGERKRAQLRQVIADAGFQISHRKSRIYDLARGSVTVNGIGLTADGRTFVPRAYLRKIDGLLHQAKLGLVTPEVVAGHMGVFWSATPRQAEDRNRTEQRTLARYRQYQARQARRRAALLH